MSTREAPREEREKEVEKRDKKAWGRLEEAHITGPVEPEELVNASIGLEVCNGGSEPLGIRQDVHVRVKGLNDWVELKARAIHSHVLTP